MLDGGCYQASFVGMPPMKGCGLYWSEWYSARIIQERVDCWQVDIKISYSVGKMRRRTLVIWARAYDLFVRTICFVLSKIFHSSSNQTSTSRDWFQFETAGKYVVSCSMLTADISGRCEIVPHYQFAYQKAPQNTVTVSRQHETPKVDELEA